MKLQKSIIGIGVLLLSLSSCDDFLDRMPDDKSLPNNSVDELQQDYDGNIWVHTSVGYSIYKYDEEQFDRKPEEWIGHLV